MKRTISMCLSLSALLSAAHAKPLKVYIMAGQSNMEGQAAVGTFDYIGRDPVTAPMLKEMRNPDGAPRICDNVWITYFTGLNNNYDEGFGELTAGYGARRNAKESAGKIGPEFTFGIYMQKALNEPILIIKTAWGGKSLNTDFRPPSAGPYELPKETKALWERFPQGAHGIPKLEDREKWTKERAGKTGRYYRLMMDHIKKVLADPKRVCPAYNPEDGYELAGFVWFQGWNDMCDGQTYPNRNEPGGFDHYTELMAHFIRDVRRELSAPDMRFVIGVIGVSGDKAEGPLAYLRPAMAAPAEMEEFKGNVVPVFTHEFWDYDIERVLPKGAEMHRLRDTAHAIDADGVMATRAAGVPGWDAIGRPPLEERTWRFTSFDPQKDDDRMTEPGPKRFRDVSLPDGLGKWYMPQFDDSEWDQGRAPIGKGIWKHHNRVVRNRSDWGAGEFLLMRTLFELDEADLGKAAYRLSILSRQGFHVYLNGHRIHTYIWWKDQPYYRSIMLGENETKHLRKGVNILAAYANVHYDKYPADPYNAIDLMIEGITPKGQKQIEAELEKICSREDREILRGASNQAYHYLGSAKMMGQIGKAFAEAMLGEK